MNIDYGYKYRAGDNVLRVGQSISDLERDLRSLERNSLFASSIDSLNDPCEAMVFGDNLKKEMELVSQLLGRKKPDLSEFQTDDLLSNLNEKYGIYSLAGRYNHELLWAHYANSHKGFCIEYSLNDLKHGYSNEDLYTFQVVYPPEPPQLSLSEILGGNHVAVIQKVTGHKSGHWKYEDETRIVFNKPGPRHYHPKAITGIYFGLRMPPKIRDEIMRRLSGRGLKFYEILQKPNTYMFYRQEIANKHISDFKYLKEIPSSVTENGNVLFSITRLEYKWTTKKGIIETEFEKPVSENALKWLAELVKERPFWTSR
ncbi:MAG: DUF2971 domain-containing protein [Phycisphaerae bacterium]|nr:DUF2971 domain-containing protein [Saprospiraceae bacterium]